MQDIPEFDPDPLFDDVGDYIPALQLCNRNVMPSEIDYTSYRSKLAWLPVDIIKSTFENTTQYY